MSQYLSDLARSLKPYVPGEQPQVDRLIKLNTNENPFPPSPAVFAAIESLDKHTLKLYPDPNCVELKEKLAQVYGLTKEHVFVGNGSDEVLAFAFCAFFKKEKPILFPDITYSFYPVYCNLWEINYHTVPLGKDFQIQVDDYSAENGGVIFSNPNAPTGRALALEDIKLILANNQKSVVIVDEAYVDFGGQSAVKLIKDYSNLLIVHTFSKSRCLAGLRVGYAMGNPELIDGLERVKNSFNSYPLDRIAIKAAVAALCDQDYFNKTCGTICKTREFLTSELETLGFKVVPSMTNFVFTTHPKMPAESIYKDLRQRGILVRYFKLPRIDNHLRITVGTRQEIEQLIIELKALLG